MSGPRVPPGLSESQRILKPVGLVKVLPKSTTLLNKDFGGWDVYSTEGLSEDAARRLEEFARKKLEEPQPPVVELVPQILTQATEDKKLAEIDAALAEQGGVSRAPRRAEPEHNTCQKVFDRTRGRRIKGEICGEPAGKSGFCRSCAKNARERTGPPQQTNNTKQRWLFGAGGILEKDDGPDGFPPYEFREVSISQELSDKTPDFTKFYFPGGGNPYHVEQLIKDGIYTPTDSSHAVMILNIVQNICVKSAGRIWCFSPKTKLWAVAELEVLVDAVCVEICKVLENIQGSLPEKPAENEKDSEGNLVVDEYSVQRKGVAEGLYKMRMSSGQKGILDALKKKLPSSPDFASSMNMNTHSFPTRGGMLYDYKSGAMRPRDFRDRYTYEIPCDPRVGNPSDAQHVYSYFQSLLWRDGHPGTPEMISSFLTILAIFISGDIADQSMLFLRGDASNGKSELITVLEKLLGPTFQPVSDGVFSKSEKGEATPAFTAVMGGKRLLALSEPNRAITLSGAAVKRLTSLDEVTYRPLYSEEIKGRIVGHLIVATNTPVKFDLIEEGVRRRVYCLDFPVKFAAISPDEWTDEHRAQNILPRDREVLARMHSEGCKAALLSMLSECWEKWTASKRTTLPEFPGMHSATEEFMADCVSARSNVGDFLSECLERKEGARVSTTEVLEAYKSWSSAHKISPAWLKERMGELGIRALKSHGKMFYSGVQIKIVSSGGIL